MNNKSKSKATDDSESEYESEKVNFEKLYIGAESDSEWEHVRKKRLDKSKFCEKLTPDQ